MSQTTLAPKSKPARPATIVSPKAPPRRRRWSWRWLRDSVANLLFPPQCVFCSADVELPKGGLLLCAECAPRLSPVVTRCPACALPVPTLKTHDGRCPSCRQERPAFEAARVLGTYQDHVRQAVLKIKHTWYEPLAMTLGKSLAQRIGEMPLPAQPDLVVPVPMHWLRRLLRGTNAAQTLAEALASELNIPLADDLLKCRRLTARQSSLPASERRENVRGAYRMSSAYDICGATVLVVDDVITTAATCDEAARVLKRAGAERVFAAAVARVGGTVF